MKRKWSIFLASVVLAGSLLMVNGAPPLPVLAGIGLAALFTARRSHAV